MNEDHLTLSLELYHITFEKAGRVSRSLQKHHQRNEVIYDNHFQPKLGSNNYTWMKILGRHENLDVI